MAGANMIYGLGMLESGITFDFGQLVLDCEFARMIKFTVNGIPVNDETLAIDPIKEIGQGGDHLMQPLTLKYMRSQSRPEVIDRKMRGAWVKAGSTSAYDRAMIKVRKILETHTPKPLPENVLATIRNIVEDAERERGIK
ncbi:Trimethylamine methyltransferase [Desulfamplus magnetovallimortis]|uniref:Trimethylamine methyltransferase n=1 Tax=Desulfamplus magnetovallimortis TaxID=1246637 RepID=A0A1W1HAY6_9BACT|nr:Trimethylamine methyltransferase [Desulfamplus magnetovallimortis]